MSYIVGRIPGNVRIDPDAGGAGTSAQTGEAGAENGHR